LETTQASFPCNFAHAYITQYPAMNHYMVQYITEHAMFLSYSCYSDRSQPKNSV